MLRGMSLLTFGQISYTTTTTLIGVVNLLKVKEMKVKTFKYHLNYITQLLLDMTPAQREQVQQMLVAAYR